MGENLRCDNHHVQFLYEPIQNSPYNPQGVVWIMAMYTVSTLSIRTPQLAIPVLKFEQKYNLLPDVVSKNCWMSGKQCRL